MRNSSSTPHGLHFNLHDSSSFQLSPDNEPVVLPPGDEPVYRLEFCGYEVQRCLATGGMGVILSAHEELLHRPVAIKAISTHLASEPEMVERFLHEARLTADLQHPGIVPIYNLGFASDDRPFFSMKQVEGTTLQEALSARKQPSDDLPRFLRIFEQVCHTVSYCHNRGVIHRDLKPHNIMLGEHGEVLVMDFGLARPLNGHWHPKQSPSRNGSSPPQDNHKSSPGMLTGTPAYMPPEQARGQPDLIDARADVFGLGTILYEILVGEPLYSATRLTEIVRLAAKADLRNQYRKLDLSGSDQELVRICRTCIDPDLTRRYPDGRAVQQAVTSYLENLIGQAEHDLQAFFNICPDLFCIAGADGYFRRVNPNFSRVLGLSDAEILSRPFIERVHPDDVRNTIDVMQALKEGKPIVRFLNRYRTSSGDYRWFEWTAKSIVAQDLIFATARDVTPSLQDRFAGRVLDASPTAVVMIDHHGTITVVNTALQQLFGYTREELLGRPVEILVPESIRAIHPALRAFYFHDLTTRRMAAELAVNGRYRDGSEFPIQIHLAPLDTEMGLFALAWITPRHATPT